jgi:hypothetical protein
MPGATGTFEVRFDPQVDNGQEAAAIGRLIIDKQFRGDLEATSKGQMLSAAGNAPESAGYVAIERVTGTLHGKSGSFVLQHNGTMNRGASQLTISVVPDSGTGELEGLAGNMEILIDEGGHLYSFTHTLGTPGQQGNNA